MSFNGSGVFNRLYNWVNDKAANIKVRADRMDNELDGMATGLSTCITKDGQTTITANLPMAGFKHTGVGTGTSRTDYASLGQVQDGNANWVAAGGTVDAITAGYSPAITTLVDGQICYVRTSGTNTSTTPTFSPNGLTARTIVKNGGTALVAGDMPKEAILRYTLGSTRWELLNPNTPSGLSAYLPLAGGTLTGDTNITRPSGTPSFYVQQTGNAAMYLQSLGSAGLVGTGTNHPVQFAANGSAKGALTTGGQFVIGSTSATTSCILEAQSTTGAFAPPRMTTTEKNAISSPSAGMIVYDTTLSALCIYTSSWQTLKIAAAATSYQATPSDPAGTTSATAVMMGLAGSITPTSSGKILIIISGDVQVTGGGDEARMQIRYGTGTAPSNGAAATGTAVGALQRSNPSTGSDPIGFSVNAIVSSLTPSTAYWIDLTLQTSAGTATIKDVSISVVEL